MYHNGIVPHNCLQWNIDAHYLIYVAKIKVSSVQALMGKYLSLTDFRISITTSIWNMFLEKTTVWQSSSHIQLGGNAEFLSHQDNQEWEFNRQISFFQLGNEQFSFILLLVSLFLLFQLLITFKVQNRPNFFNILLVVMTLVFVQEKSIMHAYNPSILYVFYFFDSRKWLVRVWILVLSHYKPIH